ncbi:NTF2- export protein 2 [Kickxella alabastrina]|nr:NTF2- export protein 2 [Kickxella alabastrina]
MNSLAPQQQRQQIFDAPSDAKITQTLSLCEKFTEQYYRCLSKSTCGKFYQDNSKVIWNGTGMSGAQFKQMLQEIQKTMTHFDIHGLDCQPLGGELVLVNVSGLVKMGGGGKVQFAQTFVLEKTNGLMYIVSDCFRLV